MATRAPSELTIIHQKRFYKLFLCKMTLTYNLCRVLQRHYRPASGIWDLAQEQEQPGWPLQEGDKGRRQAWCWCWKSKRVRKCSFEETGDLPYCQMAFIRSAKSEQPMAGREWKPGTSAKGKLPSRPSPGFLACLQGQSSVKSSTQPSSL